MSKTKGNVVDPLAVMEEAGADALRFALIHGATPGQDQRFGPQKLELARNFANKLWNAARFVLGRAAGRDRGRCADARRRTRPPRSGRALDPVAGRGDDRRRSIAAIADYQFGEVTRALYDGIWSEFCDWGLELAKVRLADDVRPGRRAREATWWTLVEALDTYLRLLHPVMPFVTEAICGRPAAPRGRPGAADRRSRGRRRGRATPPRRPSVGARDRAVVRRSATPAPRPDLPAGVLARDAIVVPPADARATFEALAPAIARLARARPLRPSRARSARARPGPPARSRSSCGRRYRGDRPAAGRRRRHRRRATGPGSRRSSAEAEGHLAAARARLANAAFTAKAPPAVVDGARTREAELADQVTRLRERLGR